MLDFDAFAARVLKFLSLAVTKPPAPDDDLYNYLGIDSLQAFQLIVAVEAMAGTDVPPADFPELYTLGDAFDYFRLRKKEDSQAGHE